MDRNHDRIREAAARMGGALRGALTWRDPGGRVGVIVAVVAAIVLATGVGVWWGLASGGQARPGPAGAAPPNESPVAVLGDTPVEVSRGGGQPGGAGAGAGSASGIGSGSGSDSGSGSASGIGTGSGQGNVGGSSGNRAPVIERAGLSSHGLRLTIKPTVTDPDGDDVTLRYVVDGAEVPSDPESGSEVRFDHREVGYTHLATVEIAATDSRGATTSETYTHDLAAVTTVTVRDATFRLTGPADCFAGEPAQRLTGSLQFYGAVRRTVSVSEELRPDRPQAVLLAGESAEMVGSARSLQVYLLSGSLADGRDTISATHRAGDTGTFSHTLFQGAACPGVLSYRVAFETT